MLALIMYIVSEKGKRTICIAMMVYCMLYIGYYLWIYFSPDITVCEGNLVSISWDRGRAPLTEAYVFDTEQPKDQRFHIDIFSKKEILPFELVEGCMYRVYYETRTRVIVGVEVI